MVVRTHSERKEARQWLDHSNETLDGHARSYAPFGTRNHGLRHTRDVRQSLLREAGQPPATTEIITEKCDRAFGCEACSGHLVLALAHLDASSEKQRTDPSCFVERVRCFIPPIHPRIQSRAAYLRLCW